IKVLASEAASPNKGSLNLATTYSQARYELPELVRKFIAQYPDVSLHINQGSPKQITELLTSKQIDLAIVAEALPVYDELVLLPCYHWNRSIVVTQNHPLAKRKR